jgi:hypothetical protein
VADVLRAHSVSVATCSCGSLHLLLHDEAGAVFASATMPMNVGLSFAEDVNQSLFALVESRSSQGRAPTCDRVH